MAEINLSEINLLADEPVKMINADEQEYHKKINRIADYISSREEIRLILLAGPSGSGKTTTANLIADKIRDKGIGAMVLSLDDFYRNHDDPNYPKNQLGDHDYERPESLDLEKLLSTIDNIVENRPFEIPKYDFKLGMCVSAKIHEPVGNGCVILEGLHALNPIISKNLPRERIIRIFVSVSTNLNHQGVRILSGRNIRFIRRLVRDSIYRGSDCERTLMLWKGVLEAEDVYLYPYKYTADLAFDTFHRFELGVMKKLATGLISAELANSDAYVKKVLSALLRVEAINDIHVPADSLIREFISGGIYDDIY